MSDFLSPNSLNSGQFAHFQVGQQQQQQRGTGQTSHGPMVGQTQEKGKVKINLNTTLKKFKKIPPIY